MALLLYFLDFKQKSLKSSLLENNKSIMNFFKKNFLENETRTNNYLNPQGIFFFFNSDKIIDTYLTRFKWCQKK
jgi:hypothetical protein